MNTHTRNHHCPHTNALLPLTSPPYVPSRACPVRWLSPQFFMKTFRRRCHPQHPPVMCWRNPYTEGKEGSSRCRGQDNGGLCHLLNQPMADFRLTAVPPFSQQIMTKSRRDFFGRSSTPMNSINATFRPSRASSGNTIHSKRKSGNLNTSTLGNDWSI